MRPSDPRVRTQLACARRPLTGVLVGSVLQAGFVVGQAFAVAAFVVAALRGRDVLPLGLVVVAVLAGRAVAGLLVDLCAARAASDVGQDMRRRVMSASLRADAPLRSTGEVSALVTRGVAAAEPYLTRYVPALVLASVLPFLTVAVIATQDVMSAVIVLTTLPLVPVFGALVGLATRDRAEAQWRAMASLSGHFLDVMKGLPTLVAFRRATAQSATIRAITERYRVKTLETLRIAFASSAVLELVATLSVALVAVVVGVRLADGQLDLRTALVVLLLAPEAYWPLRRVGAEFHAAAEGVATFEQLAELPVDVPADSETQVAGPIEVTGLTVVHPGRSTPVFAPLDATFSERGITAVVGPSGSGKSTLLTALAGLVPAATGRILAGGVETRGEAWRSRISWIPQRPAFVSGTVADNLRLAAPEATDVMLWQALRDVALEDRVRRLAQGLDTPLGEDARILSAGERARLALARAVVAARPYVFLDEPTAHLDAVTERVIADTLVDLARTSCVVVVAHRESLVQLADHVLSLGFPRREAPAPVARQATSRIAIAEAPAARGPGFGWSTTLGSLASASGVALTATAGWLIVKAAEQPAVLTLLLAIVGVRAFGLARPVLRYAERLRSHDAALRLLAERRAEVYDAVVPLTPGRLGKLRGDALTSIVDDVESVLDRQLRVLLPVRSAVAVSVLATAVATYLLPLAGLLTALTCLLAGSAGYAVALLGTGQSERKAVAARAELSAQVVEAVQMQQELVMWQAGSRVGAAVADTGSRLAEAGRRAQVAPAVARLAVLLACSGGILGNGLAASSAVAQGRLSGPMLALLTLLPLALADVFLPLADAGALGLRTRAAEARLTRLGATEPLVREAGSPVAFTGSSDLRTCGMAAGWNGEAVLHDVSLRLSPGRRIGVVGPSGSGKSTLAATLLRFVDPMAGAVELGSVPLDELPLDDVRRTVGLVDDDPHVFATSLAENVRLARPGASDGDLVDVLRRAHLGSWLDGLPDGLDTWLGDGHAQVSGGERARIAVARSLLADSPLLVLDEPVASLDRATAEALARDVLDAADGRGILWITHSDVGLDRMDEVLELT